MASTDATSESLPYNLPLTPRDNGNEDHNFRAHVAGRKRNASEMDDGHDNPRATAAQESASRGSETIETEVNTSFIVVCPALPTVLEAPTADHIYRKTDHPDPAPELSVEFMVRPGKKWSGLLRFKNAKFQDPVVIYSLGQIVYINRRMPPPPAPPTDASAEERLKYDKENLWPGLISEFRAESQEKVYVRLFWLYWPEELPMGRQPYHGKNELILSNHVDIVEAQTIACRATISHWDEDDDSNDILEERYWRQTLDLNKLRRDPKMALSRLRQYCVCGGYDNPGREMFQCSERGCRMWNHDACLLENLEGKAWDKFQTASLAHEVHDDPSFGQKIRQLFERSVMHGVENGTQRGPKDNPDTETIAVTKGSKKMKAKKAAGTKKSWAGKLEAKISKSDLPSQVHRATITQLVPSATCKAKERFEPKIWDVILRCLKCGSPLD